MRESIPSLERLIRVSFLLSSAIVFGLFVFLFMALVDLPLEMQALLGLPVYVYLCALPFLAFANVFVLARATAVARDAGVLAEQQIRIVKHWVVALVGLVASLPFLMLLVALIFGLH